MWVPAVAWAALIFDFSSRPSIPEPGAVVFIPYRDKAYHFLAYGVFGLLLLLALRRSRSSAGWLPAAVDPHLAFVIAALYAFTDEVHQSFVPPRGMDVVDYLADVAGALVFAFALSAYIQPPHAVVRPPGRVLALPEGRIVFTQAGEGPAVVYLHGWHGSKRYFEEAAARLPGHRHIALDLLGFGESDHPVRFSYAPHDQARVVRALAQRLGLPSAVVVGHSMGGAVALELALIDPAFVRALVLVEPAVQLAVKAPFVETPADARALGLGLLREFRGTDLSAFTRLIFEDPSSFPRTLIDDALSVPVHSSARAMVGLARADLAPRLKGIRCPTLLVFGDPKRPLRDAYSRALIEAMPDGQHAFVLKTAHCPMIESPEEFYTVVRAFIEAQEKPASGQELEARSEGSA